MVGTNTNNSLTKYKIDQLDASVRALQIDVRSLLENHLPHLKEDMTSLKTKINIYTAVNVGALALSFILQRVFK